MEITLNPIGVIRTPSISREKIPHHPEGSEGIRGTVELNDDMEDGLLDLIGFSHIILIYFFHRSEGYDMQVTPFPDNSIHGVLVTRAPKRPNPIGLSVVKLLGIN